MEQRMMTGAEMVLQAFVDHGVTDVFGYPGGAVLPRLAEQGTDLHQLGTTLFPQLASQGSAVALPFFNAATRKHEIAVDPGVNQQQPITAQDYGPDGDTLQLAATQGHLAVHELDVEGVRPVTGQLFNVIHQVQGR